jgi:hypothetical protein
VETLKASRPGGGGAAHLTIAAANFTEEGRHADTVQRVEYFYVLVPNKAARARAQSPRSARPASTSSRSRDSRRGVARSSTSCRWIPSPSAASPSARSGSSPGRSAHS